MVLVDIEKYNFDFAVQVLVIGSVGSESASYKYPRFLIVC